MLRTCDFTGLSDYHAALPRAEFDVASAVSQVKPICDAVRVEGLAALQRFSQQFDGCSPASVRVPAELLQRCFAELDPRLRDSFEVAIARRRLVAAQLESLPDSPPVELAPGAHVGLRSIPVERVGLYVPGGLAPLASSVIMNAVPAQAAGVGSIAVASPPQAEFDGWPHPSILALCHLLGIDEVYAVGGAQAIAMFAYGVSDLCEPVSLVTGPGNIYVVAAKRALRGVVGIDSEAGPTEIAILADDTAQAKLVAADLISQAEHDPMAGSILVTDSAGLITQVNHELAEQVAATKHRERVATALSGPQSAAILVRDLAQGREVVDAYAAEHLEIHTRNAAQLAQQVRNAGAIFVGPHSPVSLGDYSAGSTHVLPTSGAARFSSGLTVRSFLRFVHVIDYDAAALAQIAEGIQHFAAAENLPAHAAAIAVRNSHEA
ncbi:MAG: histidinol dehydrogenase [Arachnia propionica]|nr:MAG: histidinol dehydrogenase [Arachnia propionica]